MFYLGDPVLFGVREGVVTQIFPKTHEVEITFKDGTSLRSSETSFDRNPPPSSPLFEDKVRFLRDLLSQVRNTKFFSHKGVLDLRTLLNAPDSSWETFLSRPRKTAFVTLEGAGWCSQCQRVLDMETNGGYWFSSSGECERATVDISSWELDVPSGELVFLNHDSFLTPIGFPSEDCSEAQRHLEYLKANVGFWYVREGQTLNLLQTHSEKFHLGTQDWISSPDKSLIAFLPVSAGGVYIMDSLQAERRSEAFNRPYKILHGLKVHQGTYSFTEEVREGSRGVKSLCIEYRGVVRTPAKGSSFVEDELRREVSFSQYIAVKQSQESSLRGLSYQELACDEVQHITQGFPPRDWHPKGFPRVMAEEGQYPEIDIPRFDRPLKYFPDRFVLSVIEGQVDYCEEPFKVNGSFALLTGALFENLIAFGGPPQWPYRGSTPLQLWTKLVTTYPHIKQAMKSFDFWLQDEDKVQTWCSKLGIPYQEGMK